MQGGKLRYSVAIQQQASARSSAGSPQNSWTTVATVRAGFVPMTGNEVMAGVKIDGSVNTMLTIRYLAGVVPEMRVVWTDTRANRTRFFDIVYVIDVKERHREMNLLCKENNIPAGSFGSVTGQPPIGAGFGRKSFIEAPGAGRTLFTLPTSPNPLSLQIFVGGQLQGPAQYTLVGTQVTFNFAPGATDEMFAWY